MRKSWLALCLPLLLASGLSAADRIDHEGRVLGPQIRVTTPTLFNTPEADTILSSMQVFPTTNAWNEDVSNLPVLSNSAAMMTQINNDLASSRRHLVAFFEMNYVLVPDDQPLVPIDLFYYADESQPPPYPLPANLPIETWPHDTGAYTLYEWQTDAYNDGGDRHAITVMPGDGRTWETWLTKLVPGSGWEASNGAMFDLNSNTQWPDGWTSGDAAGLSMFPALVRYDECRRGVIEHALRQVVGVSRQEHLYPASHDAGSRPASSTNTPAMGQRIRLKASFVVPATWSVCEKAVAAALKKYGAIVADNGNFFSVSVTPDDRWAPSEFANLGSIPILGTGGVPNFEVVQATAATTGPRSPGAPTAYAGVDKTVGLAPASVSLGDAAATGAGITTQWTKYSGPGAVTFGNAATLHTSASFSVAGRYLLELRVTDGVHTPAWSVVGVTVTPACGSLASPANLFDVSRRGTDIVLSFTDTNGSGVTGYNVYRAPHPATRPALWGKPGADVPDGDASKPGIQWTDTGSGDGTWFYIVSAWNGACDAEAPW